MLTEQFDCIVVGGGLAGCFAAVAAATRGKKTILIEQRTYLGYELTAKHRLWIAKEGLTTSKVASLLLPEEEKKEIEVVASDIAEAFSTEMALFSGSIKKKLMQLLLEHGVEVLLMSTAIGVMATNDVAKGVVIANKYGLQLVQGNSIIDATERGAFAGERPKLTSGDKVLASYVLEFVDVDRLEYTSLAVLEELGLYNNQVIFHQGKAKKGHYFVELQFMHPANSTDDRQWFTEIEHKARVLTKEVTRWLTRHVDNFKHAKLQKIADEVTLLNLEYEVPVTPLYNTLVRLPLLPSRAVISFTDIEQVMVAAERVTVQLLSSIYSFTTTERDLTTSFIHLLNEQCIALDDCQLTMFNDTRLQSKLSTLMLPEQFVPQCKVSSELLVAGGGTTGANIALTAVSKGRLVTIVDSMMELGGTQTVGLVGGYYYGYKGGYTELLEQRVQQFSADLYSEDRQTRDRIAKMLYYREMFARGKGQLSTRTVICLVKKDVQTNEIVSVFGADQFGLVVFQAQIYIDSTGDCDLASFCEEQFEVGKGPMNITQNYSQWDDDIRHPPFRLQSTHRDYDVINNTKLSELQRGLRLSHHHSCWYNFSPMLTVRDSRRIIGKARVTLADVIARRHYEDTIAIGYSDFDPHGFSDTIYGKMGFLPVHGSPYEVEIPYGACLPKFTTNLLVCCRGISLDWETSNYFRMTADLQNLGYVIGLISSSLIVEKLLPAEFNVASIRSHLEEINIIPAHIVARAKESILEQESLVTKLIAGEESTLMEVMLFTTKDIVPSLLAALEQAEGKIRLLIAKALSWFGEQAGINILLETLDELEREGTYIAYYDLHPRHNGNVKAGIVGEIDTYWQINQILVLLALAGERRVLPLVNRLLDHTIAGGAPENRRNSYISGRIDQQRIPNYDRLNNLSYIVKMLPDASTIPYLEELLKREFISGYTCKNEQESGSYLYCAILELRLAEALALCGSKQGLYIFADYIDDVHDQLSSFSYQFLVEYVGKKLPKDAVVWKQYIDELTTA